MTYVRNFQTVKKLYPQYERILEVKSVKEAQKLVDELLAYYGQKEKNSIVIGHELNARKIADGMARCTLGDIPSDCKEFEKESDHYQRKIYNFFTIEKISQTDSRGSKISRNYMDKNGKKRVYPKYRYWDLDLSLKFCIACRMSYEEAQEFIVGMMGIPWLYYRNPYFLAGDFCIRFHIDPLKYYDITKKIEEIESNLENKAHETDNTQYFEQEYFNFLYECKERVKEMNLNRMELCIDFCSFLEMNKKLIFGNFHRGLEYMSNLMTKIHNCDISYQSINYAICDTLLVTEYGSAITDMTRENIFDNDHDKAVTQTMSAYRKQDYEMCKEKGYSQMRRDMIRLLLMNQKYDIIEINRILKSFSFFELNPNLIFDRIVLISLVLGNGRAVEDYRQLSDYGPDILQDRKNPYPNLIKLIQELKYME